MTAPDPARLRELAERVQRASGPDRQLDREVAAVAGWVVERRHDGAFWWVHHGLCRAREAPPEYTASLDAAASLMPAQWHWGVAVRGDDPEATGRALAPHPDETVIQQKAPTPALALLAAALLAMAHEAEASA